MQRASEENSGFRGDRETIDAAFREARIDALLQHKRTGIPVATWNNGRVELIPADEIPVVDPVAAARATRSKKNGE
jgi:hypothetical protein